MSEPTSDNRLPIRELTPLVEQGLRAAADECGLRPDTVIADYVLNWGGFGAASFSAKDGERRWHVKLTVYPEQKAALRRWQTIHKLIEQQYHAPPMVSCLNCVGVSDYALSSRLVIAASDLVAYSFRPW